MAEKQPLTNGSYGSTTPKGHPATQAHSMDLLRTSSSKNPINTSSNVLLLYRMNELQHLGRVNFGLAVGTLLYLATNVVLFTFNAMDRNDDACGDPEGIKYARCGSPVSPLQFHIYEFWAGFLFACIEATSLIFTPRALATVSKRPGLLRTVLRLCENQTGTPSRRWRVIYAPSSRRSHGDNIASMAWGARNSIPHRY